MKRFFAESFYEFEAPVSLASSRVGDLARYWEMRSRSKHELIEAGRDAARIAGSLQFESQQFNSLREENLRLERLLNLPSRPEMRVVVARVARRDIGLWWQQIVVRRGKSDGIREGCPVVDAHGVVGRVRTVHLSTSVVELISSPSFRISAYIEGSDYPVTYRGASGGPLRRPSGIIRDIPSDFPSEFTHRVPVITTGIGGVFPPGLAIGEVSQKLELTEDGLFYEAPVELRPNLATLEEVAILVPVSADITESGQLDTLEELDKQGGEGRKLRTDAATTGM
ncbi:MAG: rod shape-determining protein MreC [Opitutae bacterium]|nr:rod shape-determining protein MreC [Opitutae bacterium]MCD8299246.1 rod shape-determining protein MreC [Opitutae bacterium]